jgi:tetratricopeptide (TPR) repeat protein
MQFCSSHSLLWVAVVIQTIQPTVRYSERALAGEDCQGTVILHNRLKHIVLSLLAQTAIVCLSACTSVDHAAVCNDLLAKAGSDSAKGDYADAQKALQEAAREAEVSGSEWQKPRVLREQASTFLLQDKSAEAEATARKLLGLYHDMPEKDMSTRQLRSLSEDRGRVSIILADALLAQKRPEEAVEVLGAAKHEVLDRLCTPELVANLGDRYTAALRASGKNAGKSEPDYEDAIIATTEANEACTKGTNLMIRGHSAEAVTPLEKAQQIAIRSGCDEPYVDSTTQLACAYYMLNRTTAAHEQALKAVERAQSPKAVKEDIRTAALTLLALTSVDPNEASSALRKASAISNEVALHRLLFIANANSGRPIAARERECEMIWSLASIASPSDRLRAIALRNQDFNGDSGKRTVAIAWFLVHAKVPSLRPEEVATCYEDAAIMLAEDNRLAESKQYLKQAIHLREQLKEDDIADKPNQLARLCDDRARLGLPSNSGGSAAPSTAKTNL